MASEDEDETDSLDSEEEDNNNIVEYYDISNNNSFDYNYKNDNKDALVNSNVNNSKRISSLNYDLNTNKKYMLKVALVGDALTGKTSFMWKYIMGKFSNDYKATIGGDRLTKEISHYGYKVVLQMWDTAGQENFSLGNAYYIFLKKNKKKLFS